MALHFMDAWRVISANSINAANFIPQMGKTAEEFVSRDGGRAPSSKTIWHTVNFKYRFLLVHLGKWHCQDNGRFAFALRAWKKCLISNELELIWLDGDNFN